MLSILGVFATRNWHYDVLVSAFGFQMKALYKRVDREGNYLVFTVMDDSEVVYGLTEHIAQWDGIYIDQIYLT